MLKNVASPARSSWSAIRSALVAEVLRREGRLLVRGEIQGESMLPTLWPGDVVEIESCSLEDVQTGDILLARRDDRLVLHRLVAPCTANGFLLRGDSVAGADPQYPPEALLGRVVGWAHQRRGISSAALRPGFVAKCFGALGILFCHCGLARRVAMKLHTWRTAVAGEIRTREQSADVSPAEFRA
jgi:hypothetical protein